MCFGEFMNIVKSKIIKILLDKQCSQREIAEKLNVSVGLINKSIKQLSTENIIYDTSINNNILLKNKVNNAIILAAGYGLRMIPINQELPKGLVNVNGEILIERLIRQLHEKNIFNIKIVVGYMKEKFEYLIDKFGVELVVNRNYKYSNNSFSLNCVNKYINNSYIIPADLYFSNNIFGEFEFSSYYLLSNETKETSTFGVDKFRQLRRINNSGFVAVGLCFIKDSDSLLFRKNLAEITIRNNNAYWEDALFLNDFKIYCDFINADQYVEINTYEDLRELDSNSKNLFGSHINLILSEFKCNLEDIKEVNVVKKGMTNRSFSFKFKDKKYIVRIPGAGTSKLISRNQEYLVYQEVNKIDLCDKVIYMSAETGIKITEFIDNARNCNPLDLNDIKLCMTKLREFHKKNIIVKHEFNLKDNILKYEMLKKDVSLYSDYLETKNKIFELLDIVEKLDKDYCLCHIDSVCDNFLINDNNEVRLIDWEYAGNQDPHIDIAMFAIYSGYKKEQIDQLIAIYFEDSCLENIRYKIYAYVAICGFLWSNWCEYKYSLGIEFGEYSLLQYRYAKVYSKLALNYFKGAKNNEQN